MREPNTPGPWEVRAKGRTLEIGHQHGDVWVRVCSIRSASETDWANARLIAAAPELLEALARLLRWAGASNYEKMTGKAEHDDIVKGAARAAVAKATRQDTDA